MWLSEGRLRRSSERHICAEKLFAKVRKSHFLGFFHWWIAVFADYRQLVLLRQIKGSTPVTSSSTTTVLLPQRLFSSVFTSRFFALSFCLAPCFLPLTPAFKAVVFFWFARGNNLGAPCFLRRTTAVPANLQMEHSNLSSCEMTMVNLRWITCDESVHMVMERTNLLLALEWRYVLFNGRHQITRYFIFPCFLCI